jgi:hypothetical protein
MRLDPAHLEHARRVADAVLYEGYLLYPYRQSAQKNQARFQFGVLMPPAYAAFDPSEPSASQTECLADCPAAAQVLVLVRFLQVQHRRVLAAGSGGLREVSALDVDGVQYTSWDEAAEREQSVAVPVAELLAADRDVEFHCDAGESAEEIHSADGHPAGRLVRDWAGLDGVISLHAERVAGPFQALKIRLRVTNATMPQTALRTREDGLRHALVAAHCMLGIPGGRFVSMTDPPQWAAPEVAACANTGTWPVLAGPRDCAELMLSAPVILSDHPEIAAESAGEMFDATEIDEILTLRTLALTDTEKQQARATDGRAAALLDRLDGMPAEMLDRLHGAIRYLRSVPGVPDPREPPVPAGPPSVPWWDPGADTSVSPETDHVLIGGVPVACGSRVIMVPGARRADAQDLFLAGREAIVAAVLHDVDGQVHLAVTPSDDPAADLNRTHGRFLYFAPDEVRPVEGGSDDLKAD